MTKAKQAESAAVEASAPADPFANVPVTRISDDVSFQDFSDVETTNPYKYEAVNAAARAERLPMLKGYKHGSCIIVPGTSRKELKQGSVYGDIQSIANQAGKAGIPVYVLLTELRKRQIGNKRSKYCEKLPPIGWAEGWLNTAITKGYAGIHPTKSAPPLREEASASDATGEEQKKIANG